MKRSAVAVVVAVMSVGCGDGGPPTDEDRIEATIKGYLAAVAELDGDTACSYMTGRARRQFIKQMGEFGAASCDTIATAAEGVDPVVLDRLNRADVEDVEITGETATARATFPVQTEEVQVDLRRVDGEWKIDRGLVLG